MHRGICIDNIRNGVNITKPNYASSSTLTPLGLRPPRRTLITFRTLLRSSTLKTSVISVLLCASEIHISYMVSSSPSAKLYIDICAFLLSLKPCTSYITLRTARSVDIRTIALIGLERPRELLTKVPLNGLVRDILFQGVTAQFAP